ncbi:Aspartate transaminase [Desulfotomaculum nigrificans CO-1-SRB]|uniref:Aspartate transaminase n=1 Tax=Desulfotomaculum nigrificans (strain DSM 14880 / VKM B-2319 / CO-1-SRB) TaxID=868595 RepID=F6B987_DESCC|nr:pyridoxal phosphate-dependent aminotransferase [Desulfotomaculum nigrificans]AEF94859.1 Aspartate transaminase [Desulfotomaculum nigrificans CO-1-SRB]
MVLSDKIAAYLSNASWIRKMFEEGDRLRKIHGADKVYDFTLGNPSVEPPEKFRDELKKLALNPVPGMHRYMSNAGYPETRAAVAEVLAEQSGLPFNANHVVMTVGAGGGLNIVLKAILNPGDEVIALSPYFVEYGFYVDNHGGVLKVVPTNDQFLPDLTAISEAIGPKTRAIIINSPNNPTGVVYPAEILTGLGDLLDQKSQEFGRPIFALSDEPYAKIVFEGTQVPSVFKHITNAILVTSHSKDLALPGERIGYVAVSPKINEVDRLVEGLVFCNRTLGFVNAPALMQRLVAGLQRESVDIAEYQEKRDLLYNHLTGLGFEMVKPQGAFYLFPKSPVADDVEFTRKALAHNILVVPGSGFGTPGYFRLAYCIDKEIIERSFPAWTALARELGLKG